jgi:hypothetical protein
MLIDQPWKIMSVAHCDWATVGYWSRVIRTREFFRIATVVLGPNRKFAAGHEYVG